jgi:AraC-like DNA-binding protein
MPFHLGPELFLQVSGRTHFAFPEERLCLEAGSLCMVPRGLPHRERAAPWRGPFANLVFSYPREGGVAFHLARERDGHPGVAIPTRLDGLDPTRLRSLFDLLPEDGVGPAHRGAVKGLLLAHLSLLLAGLEEKRAQPAGLREPLKVTQIRHTVSRNLSRSELSVDWVARSLHASPGYLSRLFRSTTGETLVAHIEAQRVSRAQYLLETTTLNVTEVARATGYDDPSYFARRFRRHAGTTPRAYRRGVEGG